MRQLDESDSAEKVRVALPVPGWVWRAGRPPDWSSSMREQPSPVGWIRAGPKLGAVGAELDEALLEDGVGAVAEVGTWFLNRAQPERDDEQRPCRALPEGAGGVAVQLVALGVGEQRPGRGRSPRTPAGCGQPRKQRARRTSRRGSSRGRSLADGQRGEQPGFAGDVTQSRKRWEDVVMSGALSPTHWLIIIGVLVVLFGAKKLPEAARGLGQSLRIFKTEISADRGEPPAPDTSAGRDGEPDKPGADAAQPPRTAEQTPGASRHPASDHAPSTAQQRTTAEPTATPAEPGPDHALPPTPRTGGE